MPRTPQTEERPAVFEAGIVYPDGRAPVLLTPHGGLPGAEAEAIARTYRDTAHSEGGRVEIHNLAGYPSPPVIDSLLAPAEASLARRTWRTFTLTFFGGVLRAVRDDGFHAAAHIPPTPLQTFRRTQDEPVGSDAVTAPEERDRLSFKFRVDDAIAVIARGHLQGDTPQEELVPILHVHVLDRGGEKAWCDYVAKHGAPQIDPAWLKEYIADHRAGRPREFDPTVHEAMVIADARVLMLGGQGLVDVDTEKTIVLA